MGKRKVKERRPYAGEVSNSELDLKGSQQKKTYSYGSDHTRKGNEDVDSHFKVQIPTDREEAILELIQESKKSNKLSGSASKRLTSKKLTDLYNTLQDVGFKHSQIEQAMSNTVVYGGDLIDTLDWLCLFTPNDQLPEGFSQKLEEEEQKIRPKFDITSQSQSVSSKAISPDAKEATSEKEPGKEEGKVSSDRQSSMKDWILRYSQFSSDEEDGSQSSEQDPNEIYLELVAKLEDLKTQATGAKEYGDKSAQKKFSQEIRSLLNEISEVEKHPSFDSRMKIISTKTSTDESPKDDNTSKDSKYTESKEITRESQPRKQVEEGACGLEGFAMFEEEAAKDESKQKESKSSVPLDKRSFEYTRKQWTGKSPKQFLIDWVRKNLPKSPPPSFNKVQVRGNLWRSRCRVQRQKEDDVVVTPDIVCENLKEAEHLSATLALYHLCKGQSVHTLLPPAYRDVWLEWRDAENKLKDAQKEKENKPRDQFVAKLIKKLKVTDDVEEVSGTVDSGNDETGSDVEESWEDIADEKDESVDRSKPTQPKKMESVVASKSKKTFSSEELKEILYTNRQTSKYNELLEARKQLPVYQFRDKVMAAISRENVVVIAGETGSGKSTQIPQFVLEDIINAYHGASGHIVCTEPRRISTISLANRVSDELGERGPGTKDSLCGYQIRFESKRCDSTRLTYCTTGVLLRQLQQDPSLAHVSCVIVDEVHERSVQSDFLLIILRELLKKRRNFKVILMSATVDADKFSSYFQHCPVVHIPGRTYPVEVFHIEDAIEQCNYKLEEDSPYSRRYEDVVQEESATVSVTEKGGDSHKVDVSWTKDDVHQVDKSGLSTSDYSLQTRNVVTRLQPDRINMDLIIELLALLDSSPAYRDIHGSVLVFMPGFAQIQELHDLLTTDSTFMDRKRYRVIPLHSVLSSSDQSQAFTTAPPGVRKVVIATNIAETGITIPDAVFVIDTGKVKENRYMETSQMSTLEEVWVSKASAKQRQGRAGRVREGFCFRLYTKAKYESMRAYSVPEILRVPLEELCLHIMKCDLGDPAKFLAGAIDAPLPVSISRAMTVLREVGACFPGSGEYSLTPLGQHLAALPVNVRVGKMLVYGAMLGCLYPVCIIGAAMTDKSPFVLPFGKKEQVQAAKLSLAVENSDHLTLLKAFLGWKDAQRRGYEAEVQYCNKYFLKRSSLLDIQNVCNDLQKLVQSIGFDSVDAISVLKKSRSTKKLVSNTGVLNISQSDGLNSLNADLLSPAMAAILKAVLTAGLYPNVAKTSFVQKVDAAANPERQVCNGQTTQGAVSVHPGSVNRHLAANGFLIYHEKVRSTRIYIRDCSLVNSYPLLLFGGDICVQHKQKSITLDDWLEFKAYAKTGVIFKELRNILGNVLERKLYDPKLDLRGEPVIPILLELLATER